jgi:hypothetical protein
MDFLSAVNCVGQLTKLPKKEVLGVMIVGLLQIYSLKISRLFAQNRFTLQSKSLFLIKSGENKALEALEKLIELKTKFAKTVYALQGSAGLLGGV